MTIKVQIGLRITTDTAEKLKEEAEKQHRSVNNLIEVIIDEYLQKKEAPK